MAKLRELLVPTDQEYGDFVREMAEMPPASLQKIEAHLKELLEEIAEDIRALEEEGKRSAVVERTMDLIWVARRLATVRVLLAVEELLRALLRRGEEHDDDHH